MKSWANSQEEVLEFIQKIIIYLRYVFYFDVVKLTVMGYCIGAEAKLFSMKITCVMFEQHLLACGMMLFAYLALFHYALYRENPEAYAAQTDKNPAHGLCSTTQGSEKQPKKDSSWNDWNHKTY